jgi:hypothetical protein
VSVANTSGDIFNTSAVRQLFHKPVGSVADDYAKILAFPPAIERRWASRRRGVTSISPSLRISAADGQFGQFYAGVSTPGAGCWTSRRAVRLAGQLR